MITVEITGREQEFSKVACISTLCSIARLSLCEAKRIVDSMLDPSNDDRDCAMRVEVGLVGLRFLM